MRIYLYYENVIVDVLIYSEQPTVKCTNNKPAWLLQPACTMGLDYWILLGELVDSPG